MDLFEEEEVIVKETVSDEVNVSVDLIYGVIIVSGELCGDADQPRGTAVDFFDGFGAKFVRTAGIADAQVNLTQGVICRSVDPAVYATAMKDVFGPESYHGQDSGFYHASIAENAGVRADRWLESRG